MSKHENPLQRTATLHIYDQSNVLRAFFYKNDFPGQSSLSPEVNMSREMLGTRILETLTNLTEVAEDPIWDDLKDPLAAPQSKEQELILMECLERVVTEGSSLFGDLHSKSGLNPILDAIDKLPNDSKIQINTNCAFLPWEILYPLNYHRERDEKNSTNFKPERLWGNRFQIEVLHADPNKEYKFPFDAHRNGLAFISLNLNPTIDRDLIASHKTFYENHLRTERLGNIRTKGTVVKKSLLSNKNSATVIYLYCHGSSSNPFSGKQTEKLQLDATTSIDPYVINNDKSFLRGPIVVLNSCNSGVVSPLSFSSFLSTFKNKRAMGLVATSFPMPASFAAAFGQKLLGEYLRGISIGDALLSLRRKLLNIKNPLGLFYSLQCPMHVKRPNKS